MGSCKIRRTHRARAHTHTHTHTHRQKLFFSIFFGPCRVKYVVHAVGPYFFGGDTRVSSEKDLLLNPSPEVLNPKP
jgi:hypothetical protein